jgi:hypothetical protein
MYKYNITQNQNIAFKMSLLMDFEVNPDIIIQNLFTHLKSIFKELKYVKMHKQIQIQNYPTILIFSCLKNWNASTYFLCHKVLKT